MDLVPRLVFTRMLHKGFCSTFQYPCSFIFFILYRFIFTPFLLIRNPPLQLTNSTKWIFSKASPVQKPSTHQSSPGCSWGDPAVLLCGGKPLFKSFSAFIKHKLFNTFPAILRVQQTQNFNTFQIFLRVHLRFSTLH